MGKITALEIRQLLRDRYKGGEWCYAEEVPNGTGANKSRTIDAIAMGLWRKSEYALNCFEIKVDRGDWLRELDNLAKARSFEKAAHCFWLVAPADIVKIEEVPLHWGWLKATASSLKIAKRAVFNTEAKLDYAFFAAVLRRVSSSHDASALQISTAQERGYRSGVQAESKRTARLLEVERLRSEKLHEQLNKTVAAFEEASGISLSEYSFIGGKLGEAVKILMKTQRPDFLEHQVDRVARELQQLQLSVSDLKERLPSLLSLWPPTEVLDDSK